MKQQLRQIYDDLSNGNLSQKEALERIEAIKLSEQDKRVGVLLATPVWKAGMGTSTACSIAYTEQHVILCGRPKISAEKLASLLQGSHFLALRAEEGKNIAQNYSEYALLCFEKIQSILSGKPLGKVLVQVVIAGDPNEALLTGLAGLLKTAAMENPQLTGQLILVPGDIGVEALAWRLQEEKATRDTLIRYEQGVRQVLCWQEVSASMESPSMAFKDYGVYMITGGLGSLGSLFAKEILKQTKEARVVLTGRSALCAEK
ncbi:MAG TPA: hypothetical protein VFF39_08540, partial [Verrucomicrobiae bacterium]|nr:hypothetical protein [Verrucomicrobiae bacterium]